MQYFMQPAIERALAQPLDKVLGIECAFHARFNRMSEAASSPLRFKHLRSYHGWIRVKARTRVREIANLIATGLFRVLVPRCHRYCRRLSLQKPPVPV
jgi:hypothetical protein